MIYNIGCWMCGSSADSREHRYKNSEIKRAFPASNKDQFSDCPGIAFNFSYQDGNCYWVRGANQSSEKYPRLICTRCNNKKTQLMDNAYEQLSKWCWENPEETLINLSEIWGDNYYKEVSLFYGYCLKILGCEILNSKALLPDDFPNPLSFVLENSKLQISICKAATISALHPRITRKMAYKTIGKGCLFGNRLLNNDNSKASKITGIINLVWFRIIGNYQINFWYNMEPNLCLGATFDGKSSVYDVPDLGLDCFDMDYVMHAIVYGPQRVRWLTNKAQSGNPWIQYKLALMYARGNGVKKNFKKALEWYKSSVDLGNPLAMFDLGCMYFNGEGIEKDIQKAIDLWNIAAEEDYPPAQNNLGHIFLKGIGVCKDYAKALNLFRESANKGYARAQHNLGYMHADGLGVEKNPQAAFHFYSLAAEQGCPLSQNNLGCMFASGVGIEKDEKVAIKWWKKAAKQGHSSAQKNLTIHKEGLSLFD